jgi:hypothetical protein
MAATVMNSGSEAGPRVSMVWPAGKRSDPLGESSSASPARIVISLEPSGCTVTR